MLVITPRPRAGAGRPCPEDGRKAVAETTSESGGRRVPSPVDRREPLLLQKESAVAAEKTPFPAEKGRLDERLQEWMRWCEMPFPCPSKESVGEERSPGRIGDCGRRGSASKSKRSCRRVNNQWKRWGNAKIFQSAPPQCAKTKEEGGRRNEMEGSSKKGNRGSQASEERIKWTIDSTPTATGKKGTGR
jgi:hypothetical protein